MSGWRKLRRISAVLCLGTGLSAWAASKIPDSYKVKAPEASDLPAYAEDGGVGRRIVRIAIEGEINKSTEAIVLSRLKELEPTDVVLFVFDTPGGRVDVAQTIRDEILRLENPTVAFIPNRSYSAGTYLALACQSIMMSRFALLGDVQPIFFTQEGIQEAPEKIKTVMRKEMRLLAEERGRNPDLAEAMVDPEVELEGWIEKGKLLTLHAREAVDVGYAEAVVESEDELLDYLNLGLASVEDIDLSWSERLASFLTSSSVAAVLTSLGLLLLMFELYSPGFGIMGLAGLLIMGLAYFGHYTANLAGTAELVLILLGIVLLAVEIFVIPGFGVAGISGILCVLIGIALMRVPEDLPGVDPSGAEGTSTDWLDSLGAGLMEGGSFVLAVIALTAVGFAVLVRFVPASPLGRWIVFRPEVDPHTGTRGVEESGGALKNDYAELVGKIGQATSALRPSGTASFEGFARLDVQTDGEFLESGARVRVISATGSRVVVESIREAIPEA